MSQKQILVFVCMIVLFGMSTTRADMIGHWSLDETSGSVATDSSGLGHDGTYVDSPDLSVVAVFDTGMDSSNGYLEVDLGADLPIGAAERSVALWVNFPAVINDRKFVSYGAETAGQAFAFCYENVGGQDGVRFRHWGGNMFYPGLVAGEWTHVTIRVSPGATIVNDAEVFLNGVISPGSRSGGSDQTLDTVASPFRIGTSIGAQVGQVFVGAFDDVFFFNHALTEQEIAAVMAGGSKELASDASPADGATDIWRDSILAWEAGEFAREHNVYLGTDFDDVNNATTGVSMGQTDTRYDAGTLAFDQTYYWRVDEVNGAPDRTVFKGDVWSFTVEPTGIPVTNITATASGENPGMEPVNTINGSGLNAAGEHSNTATDMWLAMGAEVWIQYEFDQAYPLYDMTVWNSNQLVEAFIGFGIKDALVETSLDGEAWTTVEDNTVLGQGSGMASYMANTTLALNGTVAQYLKITGKSAYGLTGQMGLSEVSFSYIPTVPRELMPANASVITSPEVTLSWRPGRQAASHQINLGSAPDNLVLAGTTDENAFVTDTLDYDQTRYWQVVAVNDIETPATYASEIQSFTTPAYGTVDDFESYSSDEGQEVFMTWFDGFGGDASLGGSTTGHIDGPFVETTVVYDGAKSMPIYIDNDGGFFDIDGKSGSPNFSEVVRDLAPSQDWTASGIKTLSLMFAGSAGLSGQLYCKIDGTKVLYDGDVSNIGSSAWQAWNIDLSAIGGNLSRVKELAIGVDGGSSGILYIDTIRLYSRPGEFIAPAELSLDALVAHYSFDGDAADSTGQNPGTLMGTPFFVPGQIGQAMQLDGAASYVAIDNIFYDSNDFPAVSVAAWISTNEESNQIIASFDRNEYWRIEINGDGAGPGQVGWNVMTDAGQLDYGSAVRIDDGEWHHIVGVFDSGTSTIYIDGNPEPSALLGSQMGSGNLRYGFVGVGSEADAFDGAQNGTPNYYIGIVDDLRIYHRALSPGEVLGLAGKTKPIHKPF